MPETLREIIGKREVWRSLGTDSPTVALRRSHQVAAAVEREFEEARKQAGLTVDHVILSDVGFTGRANGRAATAEARGLTLSELYDAYMVDPTRDWSPNTRFAYETTRRLTVAVLGADTPVRAITRNQCRELIETLRWLPRHASKLYPGLGPVEIATKAREEGRADLISPDVTPVSHPAITRVLG